MKGYYNNEKGVGLTFDDIYLLGGARTPFGRFCGTLGTVSPTDLGIAASKGALQKAGVKPEEINQVIVANIGQACGDAYFLPRHIALYTGIPEQVPALMVQRICASGLETIVTGGEQIMLGKAGKVLCCGTENMSLAPTVSFGNRMGYALGRIEFKDMLWEALDDTAAGDPMGGTAENLAEKYGITREEVDAFALLSQSRAIKAAEEGFFADEIVAVSPGVNEMNGFVPRKVRLASRVPVLAVDENPRQTTIESLAKLPPSFRKTGVQTAGNSSGIVDGSASVIIASGEVMRSEQRKPLARIVAAGTCGVDPKYMGIGPVPAIEIALELAGLEMKDIGRIEINEAFGAQCLACAKELGISTDILNVNGGAIALGHPLAATGTRLTLTLARTLKRDNLRYGIASACIGGGQGTALLIENMDFKG